MVRGLYRYSRNPMYVGVTMMLIGEGIFFGSGALWAYTLIVFILFNLFIRYVVEPRLMREFRWGICQLLQTGKDVVVK